MQGRKQMVTSQGADSSLGTILCLTGDAVRRVSIHQSVKHQADWSNSCWDMKIFEVAAIGMSMVYMHVPIWPRSGGRVGTGAPKVKHLENNCVFSVFLPSFFFPFTFPPLPLFPSFLSFPSLHFSIHSLPSHSPSFFFPSPFPSAVGVYPCCQYWATRWCLCFLVFGK